MYVAWGVVPLPGDEHVATSPNLSHSILLPYTVTTVKRIRYDAMSVRASPRLSHAGREGTEVQNGGKGKQLGRRGVDEKPDVIEGVR